MALNLKNAHCGPYGTTPSVTELNGQRQEALLLVSDSSYAEQRDQRTHFQESCQNLNKPQPNMSTQLMKFHCGTYGQDRAGKKVRIPLLSDSTWPEWTETRTPTQNQLNKFLKDFPLGAPLEAVEQIFKKCNLSFEDLFAVGAIDFSFGACILLRPLKDALFERSFLRMLRGLNTYDHQPALKILRINFARIKNEAFYNHYIVYKEKTILLKGGPFQIVSPSIVHKRKAETVSKPETKEIIVGANPQPPRLAYRRKQRIEPRSVPLGEQTWPDNWTPPYVETRKLTREDRHLLTKLSKGLTKEDQENVLFADAEPEYGFGESLIRFPVKNFNPIGVFAESRFIVSEHWDGAIVAEHRRNISLKTLRRLISPNFFVDGLELVQGVLFACRTPQGFCYSDTYEIFPERRINCHPKDCSPVSCQHMFLSPKDITYNISCQYPSEEEWKIVIPHNVWLTSAKYYPTCGNSAFAAVHRGCLQTKRAPCFRSLGSEFVNFGSKSSPCELPFDLVNYNTFTGCTHKGECPKACVDLITSTAHRLGINISSSTDVHDFLRDVSELANSLTDFVFDKDEHLEAADQLAEQFVRVFRKAPVADPEFFGLDLTSIFTGLHAISSLGSFFTNTIASLRSAWQRFKEFICDNAKIFKQTFFCFGIATLIATLITAVVRKSIVCGVITVAGVAILATLGAVDPSGFIPLWEQAAGLISPYDIALPGKIETIAMEALPSFVHDATMKPAAPQVVCLPPDHSRENSSERKLLMAGSLPNKKFMEKFGGVFVPDSLPLPTEEDIAVLCPSFSRSHFWGMRQLEEGRRAGNLDTVKIVLGRIHPDEHNFGLLSALTYYQDWLHENTLDVDIAKAFIGTPEMDCPPELRREIPRQMPYRRMPPPSFEGQHLHDSHPGSAASKLYTGLGALATLGLVGGAVAGITVYKYKRWKKQQAYEAYLDKVMALTKDQSPELAHFVAEEADEHSDPIRTSQEFLWRKQAIAVAEAFQHKAEEGFGLNATTLRNLTLGVAAIKSTATLIGWLVNLVPTSFVGYLLEKYPKLALPYFYERSGWKKIRAAMQKLQKEMKEPKFEHFPAAEKLVIEANRMLLASSTEPWVTHAEKHLEDFKTDIKKARSAFDYASAGLVPTIVYMAGIPRIGKTVVSRELAKSFAAGVHGKYSNYGFYERGAGQYMEGLDDQPVIVYPELFGSTTEENTAQAGECMAIGNGHFCPNSAAIGKKDVPRNIVAMVGSANFIWPKNIPNFKNYDALHERFHITTLVALSPTFYPDLPLEERKSKIAQQSQQDQGDFAHLRFALLRSIPLPGTTIPITLDSIAPFADNFSPLHEIIYAQMLEDERYKDYTSSFRKSGGNTKVTLGLTYKEYIFYCMYYARRKCQQSDDLTQIVSSNTAAIVAAFGKTGANLVVNLDAAIDEVKKDEKLNHIYSIITGVAIGVAATATLAALLYGLYTKIKEEKTDPEYGGRTRDFRTIRKLDGIKKASKAQPESQQQDEAYERFGTLIDAQTCQLEHEATKRTMWGLFVDSQHILTLRHLAVVQQEEKESTIGVTLFETDSLGNKRSMKFYTTWNEKSVISLGDDHYDIILLKMDLPVPGIKKITTRFWNSLDLKAQNKLAGHTVARQTPFASDAGPILQFCQELTYADRSEMGSLHLGVVFRYGATSQKGDCGQPIIAIIDKTPVILGVHCAKAASTPIAAMVSRSQLEAKLKPTLTMLRADQAEGSALEGVDLAPLTAESLKFLPEGNFMPIATVRKPVGYNTKSQLRKTRFNELDPAYPLRVRPAILDPAIIPVAEQKYGLPRKPFKHSEVQKALAAMKILFPANKSLTSYTFEEAINSIELNTSTGYGYSKKRAELLWRNTDGLVVAAPELRKQVEDILSSIDSGVIPPAFVTPALKDEALKLQKIKDRKTRTFQICQLAWLIVGRMVLGPAMDEMTRHPTDTPCAVGIDMASSDWHTIFSKIFKKKNILDIDYQSFEATHTMQDVAITALLFDRYYTDDEVQKNRRLAYMTAMYNRTLIIGNLALQGSSGEASGSMGTSHKNSIVACFKALLGLAHAEPGMTPADMAREISILVMGDDTVIGVAEDVNYSFLSIQDYFAEHNIVVTPAIKDATPTPYVKQTELSFCKKQILWSAELKSFVPYVPFHTLIDQLSWVKDNSIDGMEQVLNSALQWAFFYGNRKNNGQIPPQEKTFNEARHYFLTVYPELTGRLFDYDVFMDRFQTPKIHFRKMDSKLIERPLALIAEPENGQVNSQYISIDGNNNTVPETDTQEFSLPDFPDSAGFDLLAEAEFGYEAVQVCPLGHAHYNHNEYDHCLFINDLVRRRRTFVFPHEPNSGYSSFDDAEPESGTTDELVTVGVRNGELLPTALKPTSHYVTLDDAEHHVTIVKPRHFLAKTDEMSHAFFASKQVAYTSFPVDDTLVAGKLVFKDEISPLPAGKIPYDGTEIHLLPIEFLTVMYLFWRGGLKYTFHLAAPLNFTFRIAITAAYGYFGADLTFDEAKMYPTAFLTFDAKTRRIAVEVPHVNEKRWCFRNDRLPPDVAPNYNTAHGTLYVYAVAPPSGINIEYTSIPEMLIFKGGASDFDVHHYSPDPAMGFYPPVPIPFRDAKPEADDGVPEEGGLPPGATLPAPENEIPRPTDSAGTVVGGDTVPVQVAIDNPTKPPPQAVPIKANKLPQKWFLLGNYDLAVTTTTIAQYNLPDEVLVGNQRHVASLGVYYRGDTRFRVTPHTGSFASGIGIIAYIPWGVKLTDLHSVRLTSLNHALFDLSSNQSVEFFVPYSNHTEYYRYKDPNNTGTVVIGMLTNVSLPVSNPKPVSLQVQVRWENFDTFVPQPAPTCVWPPPAAAAKTAAIAKHHALRKDEQKEKRDTEPWLAIAEAGERKSPSNVNASTTAATNMSSSNNRQERTVLITDVAPKQKGSCDSFQRALYRPACYYNSGGNAGAVSEVLLEPFGNYYPFYATSLGMAHTFDILQHFYAACRGDTVFHVSVQGPPTYKVSCFSVPSFDEPNLKGIVYMLPNRPDSSIVMSRDVTDCVSQNFTAGSMLPITTGIPNFKGTLKIPFLCPARYVLTPYAQLNGIDENGTRNFNHGGLYIDPQGTPAAQSQITVNAECGEGFRMALFTGMPAMYFDHLIEGPSPGPGTPIPYPGYLNQP